MGETSKGMVNCWAARAEKPTGCLVTSPLVAMRNPPLRKARENGSTEVYLGENNKESPDYARKKFLTVTDFGGIYRRPHVHSEIRWPQVLFQKQVIAKSLFLDLLTREAGKASHMTV
jgi:hypothetical protein